MDLSEVTKFETQRAPGRATALRVLADAIDAPDTAVRRFEQCEGVFYRGMRYEPVLMSIVSLLWPVDAPSLAAQPRRREVVTACALGKAMAVRGVAHVEELKAQLGYLTAEDLSLVTYLNDFSHNDYAAIATALRDRARLLEAGTF